MKTLNVLLVDDDQSQADLLLECSDAPIQWSYAADGCLALDRLRRVASALPDLVLLDLNMPGMNGQEVLRNIRSDERLRLLPVIIFSHSSDQRDVAGAYGNGANCYITKPLRLEDLQNTISQLERYWSKVATLPRRTGSADWTTH